MSLNQQYYPVLSVHHPLQHQHYDPVWKTISALRFQALSVYQSRTISALSIEYDFSITYSNETTASLAAKTMTESLHVNI
jgi:hypothetical protein